MAHFAELDSDNFVLRTIVVGNQDCLDENGVESEEVGAEFCRQVTQTGSTWLQCSYNSNIRGCFPMPGYRYDADQDIFIAPPPEEPSAEDLLVDLSPGTSDTETPAA